MRRYIFTFHMLKKRMRRKGISVDALAKACGISTWALGEKLRGHFDFKASEIMVIAETLDIPDKQIPAYFFYKQFEISKTNGEEAD